MQQDFDMSASKGSILISKLIFAVCVFGGFAFAILAFGFILGRKFPEGAAKKTVQKTRQRQVQYASFQQTTLVTPTSNARESQASKSAIATSHKPILVGEGPYYPIYQNGKWGFQDKDGKLVVGASFLKVMPFKNGLAPVQTSRGWGFISKELLSVVPPKYEMVRHFSNGLAAVQLHKHWGYINDKGKVVIPFQFDLAGSFDDSGNAIVGNDGQRGQRFYIDKNGACIGACAASKQPIVTKRENWYGLVGHQGRELTGFVYDSINYAGGRMVPFKRNEKWGVYDLKKMSEAVMPMYEYIGRFQEGMAGVKWGEKWGYINYSGAVIEPGIVYDRVGAFSDGKAYVKQNGKQWLLVRGKRGLKKKRVKQ